VADREQDKTAIREAILRYCRGCDRSDIALIQSAYHPDAIAHHGAAFQGNAWEAFAKLLSEPSPRLSAQHHITNQLIDFDGDTAWSETYYLAYYLLPTDDGGTKLWNVGGRYIDRFERRGGAWRIAHRIACHDWDRVDPIVETAPGSQEWIQGKADRTDPSHQRQERST